MENSQRNDIANRVEQPHQLNANQRHLHFKGKLVKCCEDTVGGGTAAACRPLQEHQWKSCDITKQISGRWWDFL
eukprot:1160370-Pelagomonas_calceolata.AAC.1